MMLVTLAEAKEWLRVDGDHDDASITMLIEVATDAVIEIADDWEPIDGEPVPPRITLAVLAHVARAYDNRDDVEVPASAVRLVMPLRRLSI